MKIYKNLIILFIGVLGALMPLLVFANTIPAFPMAFWGAVSINGQPAPINTVIRTYYGNILAGTATVQESGVYGYTESTKQKLIIGEGTGVITFKIQATSFNGGTETTGGSVITQNEFTSGLTVQKDLAFLSIDTTTTQTTTPVPTPAPSSGGGGGGGGGGGSYTPTVTTTTTLSTTAQQVDANKDGKVDVLEFVSLMANWGKTGSSVVADFNSDGKVDVLDFVMLMVNWTK